MLPPDELLEVLSKVRFKYTNAEMLYYLLNVGYFGAKIYAGVVGDPDDGGYEWFVWEDGKLTHSDECYGSTKVALLELLKETVGDY